MAARLYGSGACPTKKAASAAAGLHPNYLSMMTAPKNGNELAKRLVTDVDVMIQDQTVNMSRVLSILGRRAIGSIDQLRRESSNENIQLKASIDLADRAPETQKIQRLQVEALHIGASDAKALAAAMVESAANREQHKQHFAEGGEYIKVDLAMTEELPEEDTVPVDPDA
jgi:hypothetical protein